jgi:hypothetical protein
MYQITADAEAAATRPLAIAYSGGCMLIAPHPRVNKATGVPARIPRSVFMKEAISDDDRCCGS